jgi:glycosyltransferase involved in cell wall biosynthesis
MYTDFKDRILIDSVYCHQGGGKTILDHFIKEIIKNNKQDVFYFLVDDRYKNSELNLLSSIKANEKNRYNFFKRNKTQIRSLICFGNVPPPIYLKCKVLIYFQNDLLIDWNNSNYNFLSRFLFRIKNRYLKIKNQQNYIWIVQTNLMKTKLQKSLNLRNDNIKIYPLFFEKENISNVRFNKKFLYVGDNKPHKNLINLLNAFNLITDHELEIHLTITENEFKKLKIEPSLNKNIKLYLHGEIAKLELYDLYTDCCFFVYPSLKESFGLPLIEATLHGCKVIASDLDYVKEIILPSLYFNPQSTIDISNKIKLSLNDKCLIESKVKVRDKTLDLISYLEN